MLVENSKMIYKGSDELARVYRGDHNIVWEPEEIDYSSQYLTFEVVSSGEPGEFVFLPASSSKNIQFSKNDGPWIDYSSSTSADRNVVYKDRIRVKGNNSSYTSRSPANYSWMKIIGTNYRMFGNTMSLVWGDDFIGKTTLLNDMDESWDPMGCFSFLFRGEGQTPASSTCISIEHVVLPAESVPMNGYYGMFAGMNLIKKAPVIQATTIGTSGCGYMFGLCSSLKTACELPAEDIGAGAYMSMFSTCNALEKAPTILPCIYPLNSAYRWMFYGCGSLEVAPELPAVSAVSDAYKEMFINCRSLKYVKCMLEDENASTITPSWMDGVSSTGTFVKSPNMSGWTRGKNGIPNGWTIVDAT